MKEIKIWLLDAGSALACLAVLMLASCDRSSGDKVTGTYVSTESGEYSISKDTLLILNVDGEKDYRVIRSSGFQKIRSGKLQPEEIKVQEFFGKYDAETAILAIEGEDKRIRFFAGGKSLLLVKREYQKVLEP